MSTLLLLLGVVVLSFIAYLGHRFALRYLPQKLPIPKPTPIKLHFSEPPPPTVIGADDRFYWLNRGEKNQKGPFTSAGDARKAWEPGDEASLGDQTLNFTDLDYMAEHGD